MTHKLNQWQEAIARTYGDGDFAYVIDDPSEINNCDDTLFIFLMIEMSESEGCTDMDDAQGRIERAIQDLETARDALQQLPVEVTLQ